MTEIQTSTLQGHIRSLMGRIERGEDIVSDLDAIDRVRRELDGTAPFQLMHFLENRSYRKALEYLSVGAVEGDPDRPDCDE
jgi:hypothetical protein